MINTQNYVLSAADGFQRPYSPVMSPKRMINRSNYKKMRDIRQIEEDFQNADTLKLNDFQYTRAAQDNYGTQYHPNMPTQYLKTYKDFVLEDLVSAFSNRAVSPRHHFRSRYEQPNKRNVFRDARDQKLQREWDQYHAKMLGWKPPPDTKEHGINLTLISKPVLNYKK